MIPRRKENLLREGEREPLINLRPINCLRKRYLKKMVQNARDKFKLYAFTYSYWDINEEGKNDW